VPYNDKTLLTSFLLLTTFLSGSSSQAVGHIDVPGSRLHYVVEGTGQPCLVIGSSVYYPRTFSQNLRQHLKLIFVDLPWFAPITEQQPISAMTLYSIIDDIDRVRKSLHLKKPILLGHSVHGSIAMEYARVHPNEVSCLVTIGSPILLTGERYEESAAEIWKSASPERQRLQNNNWSHLPDFSKHPELQPDVENYLAMAPKYWFNPRYDARWLWQGMTIQADLLHHLYADLFKDYDMFGKQRSVPVPTFAATGKYDFVIPHTSWLKYRDLPNLTVCVFDKSGHTPQLEQPEEFDRKLLQWLKQHKELPKQ